MAQPHITAAEFSKLPETNLPMELINGIVVPLDKTGLEAGQTVEVRMF